MSIAAKPLTLKFHLLIRDSKYDLSIRLSHDNVHVLVGSNHTTASMLLSHDSMVTIKRHDIHIVIPFGPKRIADFVFLGYLFHFD
ncbi:hypothetical protein D3C72_109120 [compost metagenome]